MNNILIYSILIILVGTLFLLHINRNIILDDDIVITEFELPKNNIEIQNYKILKKLKISEDRKEKHIICSKNTEEICHAQQSDVDKINITDNTENNIKNCAKLCDRADDCNIFSYTQLINNKLFCQLYNKAIYNSEPPMDKIKILNYYEKE